MATGGRRYNFIDSGFFTRHDPTESRQSMIAGIASNFPMKLACIYVDIRRPFFFRAAESRVKLCPEIVFGRHI